MRWDPPEYAEPDGSQNFDGVTANDQNQWQESQITVSEGFRFRGFGPPRPEPRQRRRKRPPKRRPRR